MPSNLGLKRARFKLHQSYTAQRCTPRAPFPSLTPWVGISGAKEQQRQRRRLGEVVDEEPSRRAAHLVVVGPPPVEQVPLRGDARGVRVQSTVVRGQQLFFFVGRQRREEKRREENGVWVWVWVWVWV